MINKMIIVALFKYVILKGQGTDIKTNWYSFRWDKGQLKSGLYLLILAFNMNLFIIILF